MNDHRGESAGKKTLADSLLAIDSRMPGSSAEAREIARETLRRDRRRVRMLTWMTVGFFLLTILGICFIVWFYYLKIAPAMDAYQRDISVLELQLEKQDSQTSKQDLVDITPEYLIGLGWALFRIQAITLWGIVAVLAVMLAGAVCTVLLIMATLRRIQLSLLALSEQFDMVQRSIDGGHSTGGSQATQEPNEPR
jgi:Flp pilus assembly protein TadB